MGIRALIVFLALSLQAAASPNQILFLMQAGNTHDAIKQYRQEFSGRHNFELLQQMGLAILDQGFRSNKPEAQLLTLLGAGISAHERTNYILEAGVESAYPQLQLISLQFLARYQNDDSDFALTRAMRSDNLLIRLEAAHLMAETQNRKALGQIEGLMHKVDSELHSLFPPLFALEGSPSSIRVLQRMLSHPKEPVRIAAILSAAQYNRDDLLPNIRKMASHHGLGQQEACAYALGILRDEESVPQLKRLAQSSSPAVKMAALQALYRLGHKEVAQEMQSLAKQNDLLAIIALAEVDGSQDLLAALAKHEAMIIRIHAGLSLLQLRDPRCLPALTDVFFPDRRDLAFVKGTTPGKAFAAWKIVHQGKDDNALGYELSLDMRESTLAKAIDLPQKDFLHLAETIFDERQNDLVPSLTHLLENLQSPEVIALLKRYQQHAGAPLVRHYCALTLYRLKEEGAYTEILRDWVVNQQGHELIQIRPYVPWEMREHTAKYQITPREMSRLLIETFESFAASQDELAVDVLLEAIQHGNQLNQYALAGLLIRTVQ